MIIEPSSSDRAVLIELGSRISQHRLAHNQSQAELSRAAGISKRTLERLEAGESTQLTNFIRVLRALDLGSGLNALIPAPTPSPAPDAICVRFRASRCGPISRRRA